MATDSQQLDAAVGASGAGLDSLAFACTVIVVADLDRSSWLSRYFFNEASRFASTPIWPSRMVPE